MAGKTMVGSNTTKSSKEKTLPDGTVVETITTTTTEKFSDGSSQVKTGIETITKPPGSVGPGASSRVGTDPKGSSDPDLAALSKLGASSKAGNLLPPPSKGAPTKSKSAPSPSRAMINATLAAGPASTSGLAPSTKPGADAPNPSRDMIKATIASGGLKASTKAGLEAAAKPVGSGQSGSAASSSAIGSGQQGPNASSTGSGSDQSGSGQSGSGQSGSVEPSTATGSWSDAGQMSSSYQYHNGGWIGARAVGADRFMMTASKSLGGGKQPAAVSPRDSNAPMVSNTTNQQFVQECLNQHNYLRAKHHSPPLVINQDLMKIAQAWANQIAKNGKMSHSTCGFGENVYWSTANVDGKRPADQWYSEIKDFSWRKMEGQPGTGHFTQVIWKGSSEFGVAMAKGANGIYVVANYNPPGNFVGRYAQNVIPI